MKWLNRYTPWVMICLLLLQFSGAAHYIHLLKDHVQPLTARQPIAHHHEHDHGHDGGGDWCPENNREAPDLFAKCQLCLTLRLANKSLHDLTPCRAVVENPNSVLVWDQDQLFISEFIRTADARGPPIC